MNIRHYKKHSVEVLYPASPMSPEHTSFLELTEWENCEGYDVKIISQAGTVTATVELGENDVRALQVAVAKLRMGGEE